MTPVNNIYQIITMYFIYGFFACKTVD